MAIQRIPSFWDYLGEGLNSFQEGRERRKDREEKARQAKLGELQFLASLHGQGALPSGSLQEQINKSGLGLPPVTIQPSQAERRNQILGRPEETDIDIPMPISTPGLPSVRTKTPTFSDDQRIAAGLPSNTERTRERLQNTRTQQVIDTEKTEQRTKSIKDKDAQLGAAADRFVPMAMQRMGPAAKSNPGAVAAAAFELYRQMLAKSNFGNLPPADEEYSRSFFDKAVRDMLIEERKLEIQEALASGRATAQDRRFAQLTTLRESTRKELDNLEGNSKFGAIISMYRGRPIEQVPQSFQGIMRAHAEREAYLAGIDQQLNGLMPTGLNRPKAGIPSEKDIPTGTDPVVEKVASDLKAGTVTVKDVDEAVAAKMLTKAQADAAKKKAGVVTTKTTARPKDTTAAWR